MNRRGFILTLLGVCCESAFAGSRRYVASGVVTGNPDLKEFKRFAATIVRDLDGARALGKRYLQSNGQVEREIGELIHFTGLPIGATDQERRVAFARRVTEDYREGRTVSIDGWIVARCEACLCALVSLL